MRNAVLLLGAALLVAGVGACADDQTSDTGSPDSGDQSDRSTEAPYPSAIECGFLYRPIVASASGEEEGQFSIQRVDGLVSDPHTQQFGAFSLSGTYTGDAPDGGNSVLLQVAHDSTHVWTGRYPAPSDDAPGSPNLGFTGLNYIEYDGSELQLWCTHPSG